MEQEQQELFTERKWISASRQGNSQAFGKLVERYQPEVYGLILRLSGRDDMVEDLTQDTFVTAWQKLSGFQESGPFRAWLFKIALNKVRSYWRWQKLRNWLSLDMLGRDDAKPLSELLADPSRESDPAATMEDPKLQAAINAVLGRLPVRQREVIILRVEGLEIHEIASVLGLAEGTIKAHLFAAKKRLQEGLKPLLCP